jgi:integrase
MSDELKVKVHSYGHGRALSLVYFDPVSGKKIAKSSGTTDWRDAERQAGELEKKLLAGQYAPPSRITWKDFLKRYMTDKLPTQSPKTRGAFRTAANHLERVLNPDRLCKLTPTVLSRFQTKLREEGMSEVTIGSTLRHLRAALSWAVDQGMLAVVPKMTIPGVGGARARAVTAEEFDRLLAAVPKVRPDDSAVWIRYLQRLHLGGLRLEESLAVSWDEDAPFAVDLTGRRPAFRIAAAAQKSRRDERLPMTEDFYNLLMETPEAERTGKVFKLNGLETGTPITPKRVIRIVGNIGKKAGLLVATAKRTRKRKAGRRRTREGGKPAWLIFWDGDEGKAETSIMQGTAEEAEEECRRKRDGKLVTVAVKKFASAHDLRRSFGTRWAKRVMPAVLQRLMRHAEIATTMKYYVTMDADAVADEVWGRDWEAGNNSGNNRPRKAKNTNGVPDTATPETLSE